MNPTTQTNPSPTPPASAGAKPEKGGGGGSPFKDTLNLPQTSFAMKASLVQTEPASLKRWAGLKGKGLYELLRDPARKNPKGRFVFHDGPPYANGSIHTGHMMNKCLKDFVVRSRTMMGFDVPYVPGWDCHGLPIEHKVQTDLVEKGKYAKLATLEEGVRKMAIRRECQAYAAKYHKLHTGQMERLLTLADYAHPYLTMQPSYEGATLEVLAALLDEDLVFRALKPVHWSVANETALAEAELEYYDRDDVSVYVDFEAADAGAVYDAFGLMEAEEFTTEDTEGTEEGGDEEGAENGPLSAKPKPGTRLGIRPSFMIWTTTPWTLPANLAIAVNPKFTYVLVWVDGNVSVLAKELAEKVLGKAKSEEVVVLAETSGEKLIGLRYRHPFVDLGRGEGVGALNTSHGIEVGAQHAHVFSVVGADYVTLEDGTGLVHTAPGHGVEDYQTGQRIGLPVYCPVKGDGAYDATVPDWLRGKDIWKANDEIVGRLRDSGHLFFDHKFSHSYPHDWRSKTPVIFRCTEQWFVGVDRVKKGGGESLRGAALHATAEGGSVAFVPEWGRNRMRGMLESRPDWCISRQRAWGLPIPAFILPDGTAFMTAATVRAVAKLVREKGSDIWFTATPAELLAGYDAKADKDAPGDLSVGTLKKGPDILDVWFESGSSWNAVMRERGLGYPIDLYLEGSDQHRGWFQLSLLPALGATGKPPFKTLLTHGFMVDKDGKKLSKSRPDAALYEVDRLFTDFGADVLRWWVSSLAYENDVKLDRDFFGVAGESYRKVRNTLRFMLSNLYDFAPAGGSKPANAVDLKSIPPTSLDAWVLEQYDQLAASVVKAFSAYDFKTVEERIYDFCNETLSAVYLAAVKDRLYCDKADSPRRRQCQSVLWALTDGLCRLLAPILVHTSDEAYRALWKAESDPAQVDRCVHTEHFIEGFGVRADPEWAKVMALRGTAQQVIESGKKALGVENPLDAGVILPDPNDSLKRFSLVELADLLGVSRVTFDAAASEPRVIGLLTEPRCERSWRRDGTVHARPKANGAMLSDRDAQALGAV